MMGDFNEDGVLDLSTANFGSNTTSIPDQRRQRQDPVSEQRRHACDLADERHHHGFRRCRGPVQSGAELARRGQRRLQRRRQGRHSLAGRRRHARDLADERHQLHSSAAGLYPTRDRPGRSRGPATSTATARPTFCGRTSDGTPAIWLMNGTSLPFGAAGLVQPGSGLADRGDRRLQRRRQGRHSVAEAMTARLRSG